MNNVFISTTTFAIDDKTPLEILKRNSVAYTLNSNNRKLTENEIGEILSNGAYSGLIAGTEPLTEQVLKNASKTLKVISRVGTGMDNIDLDAAAALKIRVYNTPDALTDSVAELTITLILSSLRRITLQDRYVRKGQWKKETGFLFKDKVLGIIGFGRIGERVAQLAAAFGAKVLFHDVKKIEDKRAGQVSLDELIKSSDIISIHAGTKDKIFTKREFLMVKPNAVFINTSRGSAIDEDALYEALLARRISFGALDVYNNEPYSGRLTGLDNVILTPHIGSYAKEARIEMEREAAENLIKGLREVKML